MRRALHAPPAADRSLPVEAWHARQSRHHARADALLARHRARQQRGEAHPVWDFLFTYYSLRPAQLRRWHPGIGIALEDAPAHAGWRGYHTDQQGRAHVSSAFVEHRARTVRFVLALIERTAARPARLSCFGMHEWAMVYRASPDDVRHAQVPLRLGHDRTDAVVESMPLRCTHVDAYRFFTDAARPRNDQALSRADQLRAEQPGCVHASMDLYKWCYKLLPITSSELLLDCFELALAAREIDMRASPYDLSGHGLPPIEVEAPRGRAEYVRLQQGLAERAAPLRERIATACREALAALEPA
ncbi:3-methyladenine DNA glycosylase [Hoyosella sp. G463]|uniref:3-methyladenine DNA glycosylase n=1 Tax=Lolliginicoccus lacisalsi TaxID=2742202 RepID=A0A927PN24_9ACTN|nr:3-methyladenine DNA glycosylase [Lolliginicoccus lacisalsi]